MWNEGTIGIPKGDGTNDVIHFWIKHADAPNPEYGLEGGRIIKLNLMMDGEIIANYARGWNVKPTCKQAEIALQVLGNWK